MPGDEAILASHFLVSHLKWPNFFFLVLNPIIEDKCCKQRILNNLCWWYHLYRSYWLLYVLYLCYSYCCLILCFHEFRLPNRSRWFTDAVKLLEALIWMEKWHVGLMKGPKGKFRSIEMKIFVSCWHRGCIVWSFHFDFAIKDLKVKVYILVKLPNLVSFCVIKI